VEHFLFRVAVSLAAMMAAIILSSIAAVFLCGALYVYLVSAAAAPALAALLVGLATMIAVGLIILAVYVMSRRDPAGRMHDRTIGIARSAVGQVNDMAANLESLAAREFTVLAQAHPYRALILALFGGLAIGRSPELREMLRRTLRN
jgi:hypothetical protein